MRGVVSSQRCLTAHCLLPTAYCLLPTAYCLLPTAHSKLPPHVKTPSKRRRKIAPQLDVFVRRGRTDDRQIRPGVV